MNTHESYVSLETAKLLKEAGFKWFINSAYRDGVLMRQGNFLCDNFNGKQYENAALHEFFSAPTLAVAQRWLREEKGIEVSTEMDDNQNDCRNCEWYCLYKINEKDYKYLMNKPFSHLKRFTSYEEALEAGIQKSLDILIEEKK